MMLLNISPHIKVAMDSKDVLVSPIFKYAQKQTVSKYQSVDITSIVDS